MSFIIGSDCYLAYRRKEKCSPGTLIALFRRTRFVCGFQSRPGMSRRVRGLSFVVELRRLAIVAALGPDPAMRTCGRAGMATLRGELPALRSGVRPVSRSSMEAARSTMTTRGSGDAARGRSSVHDSVARSISTRRRGPSYIGDRGESAACSGRCL
jgi:hypothetical protein